MTATGSITRIGLLSMVALVAVGGTRLVHGSLVSHHCMRPMSAPASLDATHRLPYCE